MGVTPSSNCIVCLAAFVQLNLSPRQEKHILVIKTQLME